MKKYSTLALITALFFTTACQSTSKEEHAQTQNQTQTQLTQAGNSFTAAVNEEIAQIKAYKRSDSYKDEWHKQMDLWQDISLHIQQYYRSKFENQYARPHVERLETHENSIGNMWSELTFLEESEENLLKLKNNHYLERFKTHQKQTTKILIDIKHQLGI